MPRSSDQPNELLARARKRMRSPTGSGRELSRQELAEAVNAYLWQRHKILANLDGTYVGHLEQGRHRWPSARRREAFRQVLSAAEDSSIGFYITRRTYSVPVADAGIQGVPDAELKRRTLLMPLAAVALPPGADAAAAELVMMLTSSGVTVREWRGSAAGNESTAVVERVAAVRRLYQHGRYAAAFRRLPNLLVDLQSPEQEELSADLRSSLMAEAYQVASGLLLKTDDPSLASVAADRSVTHARRSGNPLAIASSVRAVVHTLLACGYTTQASRLAVSAAEQLEREEKPQTVQSKSLYGALLLRGAMAAARGENRQVAHSLLAEADDVASVVGRDGNAGWTAFGSTNVTLHRVAAATYLGDAGTAVDLADGVDVRAIRLPERRAALMIDKARAYSQWAKFDQALNAIHLAERHASEEVRSRRSVIELIAAIAQRSPAPTKRRAHAYARSIGVEL